jgi:hypothetical protein
MLTKEGQKKILPKLLNYLTADQPQQLADFLA